MASFQNETSHLKRAANLLKSPKPAAIFYAALEFRYAIEAMLNEYSEAAESFVKNNRGTWRVKDLRRHVDGVFPTKGKICRLRFTGPTLPKPIVVEYRPITDRIAEIVGQTDNFLHWNGLISAQLHPNELQRLRKLLMEGVSEAKKCAHGALIGAPLNEGGSFSIRISLSRIPEIQKYMQQGAKVKVEVSYL